jgi:hypothetical protein
LQENISVKSCLEPEADAAQARSPSPSPEDARQNLDILFENLEKIETMTPTTTDAALAAWKNFPALWKALNTLNTKSKDKKLDVFFRARITAMVGTLNLYLDSDLSFTWRQASLIAARAQGRNGTSYSRKIRTWLHQFLSSGELPIHHYGHVHSSILHDEDFAHDLKIYLLEKSQKKYIFAQDIVDYVASPEVQEKLGGRKVTISIRTAQRWLRKLDWRYGRKKNGMYIDGHERDDVVKYRTEFIERWKEYQKRMVAYDKDGNPISTPTGFPVPQGPRFHLILVTHDESTFYAHDRRKSQWFHGSHKATPEKKGDGASLMVSDFLVPEWGPLRDDDESVTDFD